MLSNLKRNIPAILLFVFFLSLYAYTAAPGVYDGDSGEIAAAVNELGLAHPTGFPLYMLTGKLFTLLVPIKDVAYRLNIFSAVLTASALVFVFYTLKNLGTSQFSALTASFILGLGRNTIWSNAGAARVYALSLLFVAILLFIYSKWREKQNTKYLYLYGFLWGLSMGTHILMLILGIPLLFMLWQARMTLKTRISVLIKTIFAIGVPFIQYLYLPFAYSRNAIVNWGSMETFDDFLYYITQQQYTTKMFANNLWQFLGQAGRLITSEFTIVLFVLVLFSFAVLITKDRKLFYLLSILGFANLGIMYVYGEQKELDILQRYLFIAYPVMAFTIAFGLDAIADSIKRKNRFVIYTAVVFILLVQFYTAYADNNRRNNFLVEDTARNVMSTLGKNAIIFAYGDSFINSLWYLQSIGERQDVLVISSSMLAEDWYINNLIKKYPEIISQDLLETISDGERFVMIVEKNFPNRPIYSRFFDSSSSATVTRELDLIPAGLVSRVAPKGEINVREIVISNKAIWDTYILRDVKKDSYIDPELNHLAEYYALILFKEGIAYYDIGLIDESLDMLKRSLEIFPHPETQKNFDYIKQKIDRQN